MYCKTSKKNLKRLDRHFFLSFSYWFYSTIWTLKRLNRHTFSEEGGVKKKFTKNRKKTFCSQTSPDSMGWKFWNDFVFIFKLSTGQKPIECDVPEVLGVKRCHSKPFWKFDIFSKMRGGFIKQDIVGVFKADLML